MKVPKPVKMSSGNYYIRMRLGGESISVTDPNEKKCIKKAEYIKAEYLNGKRTAPMEQKEITLEQACNDFIEERKGVLSPATIRGYDYIVNHRFQSLMKKDALSITEAEWIKEVNAEASKCSPKTLKNAWGFISSVLKKQLKIVPPSIALPQVPPNERPFLSAEQIKVFVNAIKGTDVEIAALLGLSSLRRSEILALRWENVDLKKRLLHIKGAAVFDENYVFVQKKANKNTSSTRTVPIMMDELYDALKAAQQPKGLVVTCHPNVIRNRINRVCEKNDLPLIGTHGLRHSFASLAKHLGMPEQLTMQIGGWSDYQTMRKIYTHISQKDADFYKNAMSDFYNKKDESDTKNSTEKSTRKAKKSTKMSSDL